MRALGGGFEVHSAPGQGTRACLSLPLGIHSRATMLTEMSGGRATRSDVEGISVSRTSTTSLVQILLVDDHAMMRQGLRSLLEGYPSLAIVGEASNGEEAMALVTALQPQVVIMDINLPKKNGIQTTAEIKLRWPNIIVIGLSVNADEENVEAMTRAGAALLMTKESVVEQLYSALHRVIEESMHRRK